MGIYGGSGRHARGRTRRRTALLLGLATAASSWAALPSGAQAKTVRQLQVIEVVVGGGGSITDVTATSFTRTNGDNKESRSSEKLNPSEVSRKLPVSVVTSYQHAGNRGFDLNEIKGKKGTVRIEFAVTNRTGRTERHLINREDGRATDVDVMVTTPLTVIGTAKFPKGAVNEIDLSKTSGSVTRSDDGARTVQWGAVLAPPALRSTSIFTVEMDAKDFKLDEFTLTVEPGVRTDFSLNRLIEQVFGDTAQRSENASIEVTRKIRDDLDAISGSLDKVRKGLEADTLNASADIIQLLSDTSVQLDGQIRSLVASSDAIVSQLDRGVKETASQLRSSLGQGLESLLTSLGYRLDADQQLVANDTDPDCQASLQGCSVLDVVADIVAALGNDGDTAEAQSLVGDLIGRLGVKGELCTPDDPTVQCGIEDLADDVDGYASERIAEIKASIPVLAGEVRANLTGAESELTDARNDVSTAYGAIIGMIDSIDSLDNSQTSGLATDLDNAITKIQSAQQTLVDLKTTGAVADVKTYLQDNGALDAYLDGLAIALGNGPGTLGRLIRTTLSAELNAVIAEACGLTADLTPLFSADNVAAGTTILEQFQERLAGRGCGSVADPAAGSLPDIAAAQLTAVVGLESDIGGAQTDRAGALAATNSIITQIGTASTPSSLLGRLEDVEDVLQSTRDSLTGSSSGTLSDLRDAADGLSVLLQNLADDAPNAGGTVVPSGALQQLADRLTAADEDLEALETDLIADLTGLADGISGQVAAGRAATTDLAQAALDLLKEKLVEQATALSDETRASTVAAAERGRANHNSQVDGVNALSRLLQDQIGALGRLADALPETKAALQRNVDRVLIALRGPDADLGDRLSDSGYQGDLGRRLQDLKEGGSDRLDDVTSDTNGFRSTKRMTLDAQAAAARAQDQGIRRTERFPVFHGSTPAGSRTSTVFIFSVEKVG